MYPEFYATVGCQRALVKWLCVGRLCVPQPLCGERTAVVANEEPDPKLSAEA